MLAASQDGTIADDLCAAGRRGFYGGWVTSELTGPFKGPPGTLGW